MTPRPVEPNSSSGEVPREPKNPGSSANAETAAFDMSALAHTTRDDSSQQAGFSESAAPPTSLGRFRVERLLGRGGMGSVYLARDVQLNRPVALKIPRVDGKSGNLIERFFREARAAATLSHPNICPVYDVGREGDTHFIAMGYVEGRPLTSYSGKRQPERQVAMVVRKIALALADAHAKGIVHRDLKPANIMIDQRGEPIVMDFGLACRLDDSQSRLTQEGAVIGTPAYMSPEQIDGRTPAGPASDIYSLGVVLYEMLTGQCPFTGSVVGVIGQVLHKAPQRVAELRPEVSAALDEICLRAMAKEPNERFASMQQFAQALTTFLKGEVAAVRSAARSAPLPDLAGLDSLVASLPVSPAASVQLAPLPATVGVPRKVWILGGVSAGVVLMLVAVIFGRGSAKAPAEPGVSQVPQQASSGTVAKPQATAGKSIAPQGIEPKLVQQRDPRASKNSPPSREPAEPQVSAPDKPAQPSADPPAESAEPSAQTAAPEEPRASEPAAVADNPAPEIASPGDQERASDPPAAPPDSRADGEPPRRRGPFVGAGDPSNWKNIKSPALLVKKFGEADRNRDGRLDPTEFPLHIIQRADANGDEGLTLHEIKDGFKAQGIRLFAPPGPNERGPGQEGPPPGNRPRGPMKRR